MPTILTMIRLSQIPITRGGLKPTRVPLLHSCHLIQSMAPKPSRKTALFDFHVALGGKMVDFAGWQLPVTYADQSLIHSHLHCRVAASCFDVSHMLQTKWTGPNATHWIERLTPIDTQQLAPGQAALTVFTTPDGGVLDDAVVTKVPQGWDPLYPDPHYSVVSNAGCAEKDLAHFLADIPSGVKVVPLQGASLLAIQGPLAVQALKRVLNDSDASTLVTLPFMFARPMTLRDGTPVWVTRCGYTGEDGFELSVSYSVITTLTAQLLKDPQVLMAGLGARDSLRLEAGLCLYGHDLDESTTPVEAGLAWTIPKSRRIRGGFLGAERILDQLASKSYTKKRIGLLLAPGTAPAREGAPIVDANSQEIIGKVTSGGPSPSLKRNIAMGYVSPQYATAKSRLSVLVWGKPMEAEVVKMPFVPHRYHRSEAS